MKFAVTADLHLSSKEQHPERYSSLENILEQLLAHDIGRLVIAGDLFDKSFNNYSAFDELVSNPRYTALQIDVIPGNHDITLRQSSFVARNVTIIEEPQLLPLCDEIRLLALPYMLDKSMGEILETFSSDLTEPWILIGHGNYTRGINITNPYESEGYMPVTSVDIERYKPRRVFLGHIHAQSDTGRIHLIGSPCGMDITETGRRRFLVYDVVTDEVAKHTVDTDIIFMNESLTIYPVDDEVTFIETQIARTIKEWDLSDEELQKVRLRVKVRGVSSDKRLVAETIQKGFAAVKFYKDEEPDLTDVDDARSGDFLFLIESVKQKLEALDWQADEVNPTKDEIFAAALKAIYGNGK